MSGLLGFVDESLSDSRRDPGVYILAAALCEPVDVDGLRASMTALLLPGQRKLHWRDESHPRRVAIVEAIADAPMAGLVVVRVGTASERPERQRRLTMTRLLHELAELGVRTVTLESRGRADDARDRDLLGGLRARKVVTSDLRMDHRRGGDDALLWAADAACGAITQARTGNTQYLEALQTRMTVRTID